MPRDFYDVITIAMERRKLANTLTNFQVTLTSQIGNVMAEAKPIPYINNVIPKLSWLLA